MEPLPLLLASASPRRAELLRIAGIPFVCEPSRAAELPVGTCPPETLVVENARRKASEVSARFPGRLTLGADTVVVLDGQTLGKPSDRADAARMLRALSGRTHEVMTGVCLTDGTIVQTDLCAPAYTSAHSTTTALPATLRPANATTRRAPTGSRDAEVSSSRTSRGTTATWSVCRCAESTKCLTIFCFIDPLDNSKGNGIMK